MNHQHIHMIGVGGVGMSGLARLYLHEGVNVSGSDRTGSEITTALSREGVTITIGHDAKNIPKETELVVYSDGVPNDNVERVCARERGIPEKQYFEALAEVANQYHLIAVAGTHGKTTTTAMLIDILEDAKLDPTAIVGSLRTRTGSNFRAGKGKYFVVEADEYRRHFCFLNPEVLVITNIEFDHPDYFADLADVQRAFSEIVARVPEHGVVIIDKTNPAVIPAVDGTGAEVVDYRESLDPMLSLRQPGLHNLQNAAAAIAAAASIGISESAARESLKNFQGTWRRFQFKGKVNDAPVYDDYAHHPTEIEATIKSVREKYSNARLIVVFQPHTYTRTQELFINFKNALLKADKVLLAPIYAAREKNTGGVSSEQLASAIMQENHNTRWFPTLEEIAEYIRHDADENTVVLVMGAGDVTKVSELLTR